MDTFRIVGKRTPLADMNIVRVEGQTKRFGTYIDEIFNLPMYLDEVNHSPTGFEWGYGGSGPAQLAYAILRWYYSTFMENKDAEIWAKQEYQDFKRRFIEPIGTDRWALEKIVIENWANKRAKRSL